MIIGITRRDHFIEPWKFAFSLIGMLRYEDFNKRIHDLAVVERTNVGRGREALFTIAKDKDADLLLLDTDMVFDRNALERLVESKKQSGADIICGLAKMGSHPFEPAIFKPTPIGDKLERNKEPDYGIIEIGGCGMAFTLIDKKVIKEMGDRCFAELMNAGDVIEGDLSFCIRARQKGYKIYCDTTLKIGHLRTQIL